MPEADLLLPAGSGIDGLAGALAARVRVSRGEPLIGSCRYLDTFDGSVRAAGLSLLHAGGRLTLIDRHSGRQRAAETVRATPARLTAADLGRGALREKLTAVAGRGVLAPLVDLQLRAIPLVVLDASGTRMGRVVLEEASVRDPMGRRSLALRGRVRLVSEPGGDAELELVRRLLTGELGLRAASEPVVDEAARTAGRDPAGVRAQMHLPIAAEERADEAAVTVLSRLAETMAANLTGTIDDLHPEYLHDLRVAVRRSRSVLRELRGVFPPGPLEGWRAELRWLQAITGEARDMDVLVESFPELRAMVPERFAEDLEPLLALLRARRLAARRQMVTALRSDRATVLLRGWPVFLQALPELAEHERPDAARPIAAVSGARIGKVYKQMVRMGRAIDDTSPADDLHELRKKGKELRYLLELFGAPLFDAEVVDPLVRQLKALQDVLGRHQDREVQSEFLRSLSAELAALRGGAAALLATGIVVGRLADDEQAARQGFSSRFQEFAAGRRRSEIRRTFRPSDPPVPPESA